jgi:hypothetical protein
LTKQRRGAAIALASIALGFSAFLSGCGGGGTENVTVQDSPEAKKATASHIDAMREAMQAKSKGGKSTAKP